MSIRHSSFIATVLLFGTLPPAAAQTTTTFQEQHKLIKAPNAIAAIGTDLFGDTINFYSGTLQFTQTDVSLLGNNALRVAVGRSVTAGRHLFDDRPFGRWNLDIPRIYGMFPKGNISPVGWKAKDGSGARCSNFGAPPPAKGLNNSSDWDVEEFWQGNYMYIPEKGEQQLLARAAGNTATPSELTIDGITISTFPVVTSGKWSIGCLPSLKNDSTAGKTMGQGFVAVSPDGTIYKFDWIVNYAARSLTKLPIAAGGLAGGRNPVASPEEIAVDGGEGPPAAPDGVETPTLPMIEVWILPSKVIDRFGNTVTYTYNPSRPANLKRIESNDGRVITLTYVTDANGETPRVKTVFDGTRTWTYTYQNDVLIDLVQVLLPDRSKWQLAGLKPLFAEVHYNSTGTTDCVEKPFPFFTELAGTITHPSGAIGTFILNPKEHGRSDVPNSCTNGRYLHPVFFYTNSLTEKSISGPGIEELKWSYRYGPANASFAPCMNCVTSKSVEVTDPEGDVTRYVYGNRFFVSEGKLQQVDIGWTGSSALRTTKITYRERTPSDLYPEQDGTSDECSGLMSPDTSIGG